MKMENSKKKKKKKNFFFFLWSIWEFFVWNWEKNILFGIGNGAEFWPQNPVIESPGVMQKLLLKRNHLFFLHFFTSQKMHMINFCGSQAQISTKKNGIRSKIFIGHSVCRWRTIYRTAPIITGNVRRPLGNTGQG